MPRRKTTAQLEREVQERYAAYLDRVVEVNEVVFLANNTILATANALRARYDRPWWRRIFS